MTVVSASLSHLVCLIKKEAVFYEADAGLLVSRDMFLLSYKVCMCVLFSRLQKEDLLAVDCLVCSVCMC